MIEQWSELPTSRMVGQPVDVVNDLPGDPVGDVRSGFRSVVVPDGVELLGRVFRYLYPPLPSLLLAGGEPGAYLARGEHPSMRPIVFGLQCAGGELGLQQRVLRTTTKDVTNHLQQGGVLLLGDEFGKFSAERKCSGDPKGKWPHERCALLPEHRAPVVLQVFGLGAGLWRKGQGFAFVGMEVLGYGRLGEVVLECF